MRDDATYMADEYDEQWSDHGDDIPNGHIPDEQEPAAPPPEGILPLGHDRGTFFYYSMAARQVIGLQAAQHTPNTLMGLASVAHYWQRSRFIGSKGTIAWDEAKDWLMSSCRDAGIFDPSRLRGRGAWIDDGRSVLHLGDHLLVDGVRSGLVIPGSRYVYEAARSLGIRGGAPLTNVEAHQLIKLCQRLRWERGISGTLLAGWLAIAPVCGGLVWRSSIWLTGPKASGKTWASENIISPTLAGVAVHLLSKTTEAGIRQTLGSDALPVLFDEAEREDAAAAIRMQGVLDLVRQASSESGGAIVKGTATGGARSYRIRSMFCFSSINVGIEHEADESRLTILALRSPSPVEDPQIFADLSRDVQTTITPEFAAGLVARSVRLLPVIRHNAEVFAQAVAIHLKSRRLGDQIGHMLAGAYSLHSDQRITPEGAQAYVERQEWDAVLPGAETESDERRLLMHLTQSRVRVSPGNLAPMEVTIGRLIAAAWGADDRLGVESADAELRSIGIRADANQGIFVSTNHPALKRIFQGTPWSAGWSRALARLPGVENSQKPMRFGPMHNSRASYLSRVTLES